MGAGEERRKLLCQCGKPLGIFTAQGLELYVGSPRRARRCRTRSAISRKVWPSWRAGDAAGGEPRDHDRDRGVWKIGH
jgi:hypothetical protein